MTGLGLAVAMLLGATKNDVASVVVEVRLVGTEIRRMDDRHADLLVQIRDRLPSPRESS
jgi:hypothetical protein